MITVEMLRENNPWWFDPGAMERDLHIQEAETSPLRWEPALLDEFALNEPLVYTLRGPRQVGKTTLAKLLIRRLLREGHAPRRILYLALDLVSDPEDLVAAVRQWKQFFPGESSLRRWILFDEISQVRDWQRAVKYLRDIGQTTDDFLLLTGSSASDIRRGAERLPGRRGSGERLDKVLWPLSFPEFIRATREDISLPERRLALEEFSSSEVAPMLEQALLWLPDMEHALQAYLTVGGFPRPVADFLRNGEVQSSTVQIHWAALAGEVERWGKDRTWALKLMERVGRSLGSVLSWNALAEEIGIASPQTVREYVEILAEAFALLVVYFWDRSKNTISLKKRRKVYFSDPLFAHLPAVLATQTRIVPDLLPERDLPKLVENAVARALFAHLEQEAVETFSMPQRLHYWRSTANKEVDFLGEANRKIPVEVKFQRRIRPQELLTLRNSFGYGLVLSRDRLDLSGPIKIVPAALFLALLEPHRSSTILVAPTSIPSQSPTSNRQI